MSTAKKESPILVDAALIAIPKVEKGMEAKMISLRQLWSGETTKQKARAEGCVVPDSLRCVQCGVCSYSCPVGIDVRRFAWEGKSVKESYCLTCGECVARCPRGALRFERSNLFDRPHLLDREV
jgi:ferredoxin